ncbi:MAG TPA: DUF167 domain-containing protein [Kiritimatiellia bacterium]|jgi:hypothetical protein
MTWFKITQEGVIVAVRLVPRSAKNMIDGVIEDALKIRLRAPPVEGKANTKLMQFLADELGISTSQIKLLSGERARNKLLFIRGIDPVRVAKLVPEVAPPTD